jgi:hypothetical protein
MSLSKIMNAFPKAVPWANLVCRGPLTIEAGLSLRPVPYVICGVQSDSGTGYFPSTSVFPCRYQTTIDPYSITCHPRYVTLATESVVQYE